MIGKTLLHYEITDRIGAGGMGEVFRASDTTLGRDVAIKVLPGSFASDPERLARFEREARLLASLNHPNVASIHGFEQAEGQRFLVLELAEGEDLSQRIARGPLPVDEAIGIAKQIAEALEEAHAKGIVHRDLKPANVKLSPDGKVKVLDFGLAKAWIGDAGPGTSSSAELSQSPTLAHGGATQAGLILGTAAYMSPEQARGRPVDRRADIWALGVVLYEMLTGQQLFTGETVSDVLATVLTREPDWTALPQRTPPSLRRLLQRCLARQPRERLHDAADARIELEAALAEGDGTVAELTTRRGPRSRLAWLPWGLLAALGLAWGLAPQSDGRPRHAMRLEINPPPGMAFGVGVGGGPVLSPDGRRLVFSATPDEIERLYVRELDSGQVRELPETRDATHPFWSPDSRSLGFFAKGKLWTADADGGSPVSLCDAQNGRGGTWNDDGLIVFAPSYMGRLLSVPANGGECAIIPGLEEIALRGPHFLPDGRHLLVKQEDGRARNRGWHDDPRSDARSGRVCLSPVCCTEPFQGELSKSPSETAVAPARDTENTSRGKAWRPNRARSTYAPPQ